MIAAWFSAHPQLKTSCEVTKVLHCLNELSAECLAHVGLVSAAIVGTGDLNKDKLANSNRGARALKDLQR